MMTLIFLTGVTLGTLMGWAFTKAWHHRWMRDGFLILAERARDHDTTPADVSDAFGSGRRSGGRG